MSRSVPSIIVLACAFALGACAAPARSRGSGAFEASVAGSGMARLNARRYIVVNDTAAGAEGPRLGMLAVDGGRPPRYAEFAVDWESVGGRAGGLQALCAVPDRAGEFLTAEGVDSSGRSGRAFQFAIDRDAGGAATVRMIRAFPLPRLYGRLEGIAIGRAANGALVLILGEAGDAGAPAKLSWGPLEMSEGSISFQIEGDLTAAAPWPGEAAGVRDCTDLVIDGQNRLWVVATAEAGGQGPFRSVIYRFGDFDPRRRRPMMSLDPLEPTWTLDGFRVRAAALAPADDQALCVLSDDGPLGGAWRSLARPRSVWDR